MSAFSRPTFASAGWIGSTSRTSAAAVQTSLSNTRCAPSLPRCTSRRSVCRRAGDASSHTPALRGAFEGRKSKQISAVKRAGLSYVAVVASTNSDIRVQPLVVAGAMFGNLAVTLRVGPEASERPDGRTVFGGGGRVQPGQFHGVSAVAILEGFNPTQDRLEAATKARLACLPDWNATMTPRQIAEIKAAIAKLSRETAAELIAGGAYDPLARRARLIVLHNPYASFPLVTCQLVAG